MSDGSARHCITSDTNMNTALTRTKTGQYKTGNHARIRIRMYKRLTRLIGQNALNDEMPHGDMLVTLLFSRLFLLE